MYFSGSSPMCRGELQHAPCWRARLALDAGPVVEQLDVEVSADRLKGARQGPTQASTPGSALQNHRRSQVRSSEVNERGPPK